MQVISLAGQWDLIERPLSLTPDSWQDVAAAETTLTVQVPGDVTDALVRAGRLAEPLEGLNFADARWVEERSWWLRRRVTLPNDLLTAHAWELLLDGLDVHADVWFDGISLGHHRSTFYPFSRDVTPHLHGNAEHTILVRLTTGMEHVPLDHGFALTSIVPTEAGRGYPERGDQRRIFLRKPAYTWGWDWGPHLATCGITMGAELRARQVAEIKRVQLRTSLHDHTASVHAAVEIDYDTLIASTRADVTVTLTDADGTSFAASVADRFIASGYNVIDLRLEIPNARLWWPNGHGEQHLYQVTVCANLDGTTIRHLERPCGLRTISLDTAPDRFAFIVNGIPIFAKGGNWIPADSLYGRVSPEKVTRLVDEAAEANFNILRIWGGGRYEQDAFYDACDRRGILLWHDFMSACAPLPAHLDWFRDEFMHEAEYQVRRLHNRTCMALWCGNNEVSQIYAWNAFRIDRDPAWILYHQLLPRLIREAAPHIPYWPTSPYGGKENVHDPRVGDDHHWIVMRPQPEFWSAPEYWDNPSVPNFNSEYGYGGPCCRASTERYLGTDRIDLGSELVRQHTNSFYDRQRVNFSIDEHYVDPARISVDEYILYGGLCQGLNLGYSLESLRANRHSMGGIFWMYNDTWGENGWTIIDYYLRRKISWYNVKRCLAPRRLVLRQGGKTFGGADNEIVLIAINDSPTPLDAEVDLGWFSWDGTARDMHRVHLHAPPRSHGVVSTVPRPAAADLQRGTVGALPSAPSSLTSVTWYHSRFRQSGIAPAIPRILDQAIDGNDLLVTLTAETFAHAVHLDIPDDFRLDDHYFDLLPGERRQLRIIDGKALKTDGMAVYSLPEKSS